MVREAYRQAMAELEAGVVELGHMVAGAVRRALAALERRDHKMADQVILGDLAINRKRFEIEEKCLELLATQQPMASDLRVIAAMLHIVTDLERMGDHAEGLAKIVRLLGDEPLVKPLIDIPRMAELSLEMLAGALQAFVDRDAQSARRIATQDDVIDALHDQVHRELFLLMIQDPKVVSQATYLMWASHNLERIADLVTNLCERIVFVATGQMEELNVSKQ